MARKSRKNVAPVVESVPVQMMYSVAGYVRLSSDDRRKKGDSIETQKSMIENYIAACPDLKLHGFYIDNAMTGTNFERPAFKNMLADAEAGKINCIMVKDLSRFGRNAIDTGFYIEKILPVLGVRFIAITDHFDSNEDDGGIILPLKAMINEAYALDIGRKVKAVQQQNIQAGRFIGRMAPYGYAKAPEDCHKLIIDGEAAAVVKQVFGWACQGIKTQEITRRLNDAGILPPSRYKQARGLVSHEKLIGTEYWKRHAVCEMLADRVYVGDMVQGKTRKVNNKQISVSPDEWVVVEKTHEPIVSRQTFDQAQRSCDRTTIKCGDAYSPNLFKGKIFCARCGHAMNRKRQNKDGIYWFRCESQWKYKNDACVQVSVKDADLLTNILMVARKHFETLCGKGVILWQNRAAISAKQTAAQAELSSIRQRLSQNGKIMKSLYESLVSGIITEDEFRQMKSDYEAQNAAMQARAESLETERQDFERQNTDRFDLFERLRDLKYRPDLTQEVIDALVERVLVYPDKSVEVIFKFQDEFKEAARVG